MDVRAAAFWRTPTPLLGYQLSQISCRVGSFAFFTGSSTTPPRLWQLPPSIMHTHTRTQAHDLAGIWPN